MTDIEFVDQSYDAFLNIQDPDPEWANEEDCGAFTCTGLYNLVIRMEQVSFSGTITPTPAIPASFQITSDNAESTSV